MATDTEKMRAARHYVMTNLKTLDGVTEVVTFIERRGLLWL